jgi:hypothetical protein
VIQPPTHYAASALHTGDVVEICGRTETVAKVATTTAPALPGFTVEVFVTSGPADDPFLFRPDTPVWVIARP